MGKSRQYINPEYIQGEWPLSKIPQMLTGKSFGYFNGKPLSNFIILNNEGIIPNTYVPDNLSVSADSIIGYEKTDFTTVQSNGKLDKKVIPVNYDYQGENFITDDSLIDESVKSFPVYKQWKTTRNYKVRNFINEVNLHFGEHIVSSGDYTVVGTVSGTDSYLNVYKVIEGKEPLLTQRIYYSSSTVGSMFDLHDDILIALHGSMIRVYKLTDGQFIYITGVNFGITPQEIKVYNKVIIYRYLTQLVVYTCEYSMSSLVYTIETTINNPTYNIDKFYFNDNHLITIDANKDIRYYNNYALSTYMQLPPRYEKGVASLVISSASLYDNNLVIQFKDQIGTTYNYYTYLYVYNGETFLLKQLIKSDENTGSDTVQNCSLYNDSVAFLQNSIVSLYQKIGQEFILVSTTTGVTAYYGHKLCLQDDYIAISDYMQNVDNVNAAGMVYFYKKQITDYSNQTIKYYSDNKAFRIVPSDPSINNYFGDYKTLGIYENVLIIGCWGKTINGNVNQGCIYVYRHNGYTWYQEQIIITSDGAAEDKVGYCHIYRDRIVFSALMKTLTYSGQGKVYIYKYNGTTWVEEQTIVTGVLDVAAAGDNLGFSFAMCENILAISSVTKNGNRGCVYMYRYNGATWVAEQLLQSSDGVNGTQEQFGWSLALNENTLFVGARSKTLSALTSVGQVYIYTWNGTTWGSEVLIPDPATMVASDYFGNSVCVSGDILMVSAYGKLSNKGLIYIYKRNNSGSWNNLVQTISPSENISGDYFGHDSYMHGDTIVASCNSRAFKGVTFRGMTFVFRYNGTSFVEEQVITGDNILGYFGRAVRIFENKVVASVLHDLNYDGQAFVFDLYKNNNKAYILDNVIKSDYYRYKDGYTAFDMSDDWGVTLDYKEGYFYIYSIDDQGYNIYQKLKCTQTFTSSIKLAIDGTNFIAFENDILYLYSYNVTTKLWEYKNSLSIALQLTNFFPSRNLDHYTFSSGKLVIGYSGDTQKGVIAIRIINNSLVVATMEYATNYYISSYDKDILCLCSILNIYIYYYNNTTNHFDYSHSFPITLDQNNKVIVRNGLLFINNKDKVPSYSIYERVNGVYLYKQHINSTIKNLGNYTESKTVAVGNFLEVDNNSVINAQTWVSICWSSKLGMFVAVSDSGSGSTIMYSYNGTSWSTIANAPAVAFKSICWSPQLNIFVAVALNGTNRVYTSPTGFVWTPRATAIADTSWWNSVCWSPKLNIFVAVGFTGGTNIIMTSPDGITWTARTCTDATSLTSVCWSPELNIFVAVATAGTKRVITSVDGVNWISRNSANDSAYWSAICWSPQLGLFCAVSGIGANNFMISSDGINWVTSYPPENSSNWYGIDWSPELGCFCACPVTNPLRHTISYDGINWVDNFYDGNSPSNSICWSPELGVFCGVGRGGSKRVQISDTYKELHTDIYADDEKIVVYTNQGGSNDNMLSTGQPECFVYKKRNNYWEFNHTVKKLTSGNNVYNLGMRANKKYIALSLKYIYPTNNRVNEIALFKYSNVNKHNAYVKYKSTINATDATGNDNYGYVTCINGHIMTISAHGKISNKGQIYVYHYNSITLLWSLKQTIVASDGVSGDNFGRNVVIFNNVIVATAQSKTILGMASRGCAYVFRYNGTTWVEEQILIASDGLASDQFGFSVSMYNDFIIIGTPVRNVSAMASRGCAYVFRYNGTTWVQEQILTASDGAASDNFGLSVAMFNNFAVIGAPNKTVATLATRGCAYVFRYNGISWIQEHTLISGDGVATDTFGKYVAIYNNIIVIGAPAKSIFGMATRGCAYVFRYNGTTWTQEQILTASDGSTTNVFGQTLAIYNNIILISSFRNTNTGCIYLFKYNGVNWIEEQLIVGPDSLSGDFFGFGVSIHNNSIIIGAGGKTFGGLSQRGSAYIYEIDYNSYKPVMYDKKLNKYIKSDINKYDGIYSELDNKIALKGGLLYSKTSNKYYLSNDRILNYKLSYMKNIELIDNNIKVVKKTEERINNINIKLAPADLLANDNFGYSVDIYDNVAVISAVNKLVATFAGSGRIYIYRYNGTIWNLEGNIQNPETPTVVNDNFGYSVAIYNNVIVIGCPGKTTNTGKVYIYRYNGTSWVYEQGIIASDGATGSYFGRSVSIYNNIIIVGAPSKTVNGYGIQGQVYVYRFNGSSWVQEQILVGSDFGTQTAIYFGYSTSIHENIIVVGAYGKMVSGYSQQGQAYVFRHNGVSWIEEQILVGQDFGTQTNIQYGYSVSIYNNIIIVGAPLKDINTYLNQGQVYVYKHNGMSWSQEKILVGSDFGTQNYIYFGYSVSIHNNVIVVGAYGKTITGSNPGQTFGTYTYLGKVYIFKYNGSNLIEDSGILQTDTFISGDYFGHSVSIHNNILFVGSKIGNGPVADSGSTFVYKI